MEFVIGSISNYVSNLRRITAHRSFRRLLAASFVSSMGDSIAYLAFLAAVSAASSDVFAIGGISVAEMIAGLATLPVVQLLVDRYDKRRLLLFADIARALIFFAVAMASDLSFYYIAGFTSAAFSYLFDPARAALEPHYVPDGEFAQANGIRSSMMSLTLIIGPAIGGILIGAAGFRIAFIINAISFLYSAAMVYKLEHVTTTKRDSTRFLDEITGGYRAVRNNPTLKFLFVMMGSFHFAVGMQFPLIFVFIKEVFHGGTLEMSWLMSSMGIGGIIGGLAMSRIPKEKHPFDISKLHGRANIALIAIIDGLALVGFTMFHLIVPLAILFGFFGMFGAAFYVGITTAITEQTDASFRGRVFSLYHAQRGPLLMLSVIIGMPLAKLLDTTTTLQISGAAEIVIGVVAILVTKNLVTKKTFLFW
ncbi:MAG TPA: MFS transporter [Candidatus Kapabacteria bacterium]|nr:MFS transporter [Candidatus Kapabacteria bacterium]